MINGETLSSTGGPWGDRWFPFGNETRYIYVPALLIPIPMPMPKPK